MFTPGLPLCFCWFGQDRKAHNGTIRGDKAMEGVREGKAGMIRLALRNLIQATYASRRHQMLVYFTNHSLSPIGAERGILLDFIEPVDPESDPFLSCPYSAESLGSNLSEGVAVAIILVAVVAWYSGSKKPRNPSSRPPTSHTKDTLSN